jgi:hypothetical protein
MIVTDIKKDVQTNGSWKITPFSIRATAKTFKTWSSDIYQHKIRAVIRELSCNAVDAHTVSGNIEPFKVHLPTHLEQWFSIRDYGYGLSEKEMEEVFIVFFDSTKTDTNNLIGSYGLGSKSPLSIAESFIVHSYQNGTKSSYSLFTDENGLPQMANLGVRDTSELDGLELIVNTNAIDEFQREAVEVYKWFDKLPQINSATVISQISEAKLHYKITGDGFGMNLKTGATKAIMGGVAYEVPYGYCTKLESYIHFEIGDLSVNPGRETLSIDQKTKDALYAKRDHLLENFVEALSSTIEEEATPFQKARKLHEIKNGMLSSLLTYEQSEELKKKFGLPKTTDRIVRYEVYKKRSTVNDFADLPLGKSERYFRFKPKFDPRIRKFVREHRTSVIVLTDQQIAECLIDPEIIEDLDIMPRVEKGTGGAKRVKVLASQNGWGWAESELDVNTEYVYVDMFKGKPTNYGRYRTQHLVTCAATIGAPIPVLYGLTTAVKKKGKGVELSQFLKSKLKPLGKVLTSMPEYAKILSVVDDRFKTEPIDSMLHSVYTSCGITIEHDDSLDLLSETYVEQYPLIPHIDFDSTAVEAIKSYIQPIKA